LEYLWSDTGRKKPKFLEKSFSPSQIVCQKVLERCSASVFVWAELVDVDAAAIRRKNCVSRTFQYNGRILFPCFTAPSPVTSSATLKMEEILSCET
jgi:hypothetical protein